MRRGTGLRVSGGEIIPEGGEEGESVPSFQVSSRFSGCGSSRASGSARKESGVRSLGRRRGAAGRGRSSESTTTWLYEPVERASSRFGKLSMPLAKPSPGLCIVGESGGVGVLESPAFDEGSVIDTDAGVGHRKFRSSSYPEPEGHAVRT